MAGPLGTRLLKISINDIDVTAQVSKAVITSKASDSDFLTFADAASGGARDYQLEFIAAQDTTTGTLWDQVFSSAGSSVDCVLMPYGNSTPSATEPHFEFTAVISEPEGDFLGGEANSSTSSRMKIECAWDLTGKPTKVTA